MSWGPLRESLGRLGDLLGALWGLSWGSCGPLGDLLGDLWGLLWASWGLLVASWGLLGELLAHLGQSLGLLGHSLGNFGVTSGVLGAFWEASGCQIVPKRAPRASQISKNSLPERIAFSIAFLRHFLKDFPRFFESRAQVRVCKKCMIYMCFCMFFASRLFFERVG